MDNRIDSSSEAISQANSLHNEVWQWWAYTSRSNNLVLCGYHPDFDVTGFLVLRNIGHIALPRYMYHAQFAIEFRNETASTGQLVPADKNTLSQHIAITTPECRHFVVCASVTLLPIQE